MRRGKYVFAALRGRTGEKNKNKGSVLFRAIFAAGVWIHS